MTELQDRGMHLTDREVAILAWMLLDPLATREELAKVFSTRATVTITEARVRQIESKLISRIRHQAAHQWGAREALEQFEKWRNR